MNEEKTAMEMILGESERNDETTLAEETITELRKEYADLKATFAERDKRIAELEKENQRLQILVMTWMDRAEYLRTGGVPRIQ